MVREQCRSPPAHVVQPTPVFRTLHGTRMICNGTPPHPAQLEPPAHLHTRSSIYNFFATVRTSEMIGLQKPCYTIDVACVCYDSAYRHRCLYPGQLILPCCSPCTLLLYHLPLYIFQNAHFLSIPSLDSGTVPFTSVPLDVAQHSTSRTTLHVA